MVKTLHDTPWKTLERHANRYELTRKDTHMPSYKETYKSASLKAEDLKNKRRNLTVAGVETKRFGDDGDKLVMSFEETDKTFVLNKTNCVTLESLLGSDDTDDWVGTRITLRPDMTTFNGKPTPCIRVDSELPEQKVKARLKPARDEDEEEIPF
jgi:hypothetical protein